MRKSAFLFFAFVLAGLAGPLPAACATAPQAPGTSARVLSVVDGDTLEVRVGDAVERVRLIGVDTPELAHDGRPAEYFALEATDFARHMAEGKRITLEADPLDDDRDKYGRLLRYVHIPDGRILNAEILREGYGVLFDRFPFRRKEAFRAIQGEARQAERGLWAGAGVPEVEWNRAHGVQAFEVVPTVGWTWAVRYGPWVKTRLAASEVLRTIEDARRWMRHSESAEWAQRFEQEGWVRAEPGRSAPATERGTSRPKRTGDEERKAAGPPAMDWRAAERHVGKVVTAEGVVVGTYNSGRVCFLNFHRDWRHHLSLVIFAKQFGRFPPKPERYYRGKRVRVTGRVREYQGRPEIILDSPSQIRVVP